MNKKELLVPVGSKDALIAAINNGADAVYLAGKKFGARAFANNFTIEELKFVIDTCHLYGVKVYITVNTLVYEDEINEVMDYINTIHEYGVDALIMQDIGLINLVHNTYPNLEIHASTQMHNHSIDNIKLLESLGIKRVVFARELSLDEMDSIETSMEKEAFIHGSLCVSYSGQCYFSKEVLDRSANRGECAGMCRLPYELLEDNTKVKTNGDYLLSPKDLGTFEDFKRVMESSVYSLKIEGRMKSYLYVALVTRIYRKLIDDYNKGIESSILEEEYNNLKSVFYREYTNGFILNNPNIMNIKSSNHIGLYVGKVMGVTPKKIEIKLDHGIKQGEGIRFKNINKGITLNFIYDKKDNLINMGKKGDTIYLDNFINLKYNDTIYLTNPILNEPLDIIKKIPVDITFKGTFNNKLELNITDGINNVTVYGNMPDKAINSPTSKEDILKHLSKLGDTPYTINNSNIILDNNLFIRINDLNNLRRDAIDKLNTLRISHPNIVINTFKEDNISSNNKSNLYVLARTKEQVEVLKTLDTQIIVDNPILYEEGFIFKVPRNLFKYNIKYKDFMCTSYATLDNSIISDYFLNITNHYSLNLLRKKTPLVTLSVENTYDDIKSIMSNYNTDIGACTYIYGNIELMMMKACMLKNLIGKDKCTVCSNNKEYLLKDRNNALYKILTDKLTHTSYILSYKKTNLIDKIKDYKKLHINNFRIDLLDESKEDTIAIVNMIKEELQG